MGVEFLTPAHLPHKATQKAKDMKLSRNFKGFQKNAYSFHIL